jgi:predicted nucleic acid-binding protein
MKLVLDTNVVSQLVHPQGSVQIKDWLATRRGYIVYTTSVTQAEILFGIRRLPDGKRRDQLLANAVEVFSSDMAGRILSFDSIAADEYSQIVALWERSGRPISQFDGQIAAICRVYGAVLATRNVKDFVGCGVDVVNPWA